MDIAISDLVVAYRKAKVDAFYETGHLTSLNFALYEQDLFENLTTLQLKLQSSDKGWFQTEEFVGTHKFLIGWCPHQPISQRSS